MDQLAIKTRDQLAIKAEKANLLSGQRASTGYQGKRDQLIIKEKGSACFQGKKG